MGCKTSMLECMGDKGEIGKSKTVGTLDARDSLVSTGKFSFLFFLYLFSTFDLSYIYMYIIRI